MERYTPPHEDRTHPYHAEYVTQRLVDNARELAHDLATGADTSFATKEEAEAYTNTRVIPFLQDTFPPSVIVTAHGPGVSIPIVEVQKSDEGDEMHIRNRMQTLAVDEPPVNGNLCGYNIRIVEDKETYDGSFRIQLSAGLRMFKSESENLGGFVPVTIGNIADVSLDDSAEITIKRLQRLWRTEGLVMTARQAAQASELAATLGQIDQELLDVHPSAFHEIQRLDNFVRAGNITKDMLEAAGDNGAERLEIIDLLQNGFSLVNRTVIFNSDRPLMCRVIASEKEGIGELIPVIFHEEKGQRGIVVGIIDCESSTNEELMPKNVPQLVIQTNNGNRAEQIFCYAPMTRISSLKI